MMLDREMQENDRLSRLSGALALGAVMIFVAVFGTGCEAPQARSGFSSTSVSSGEAGRRSGAVVPSEGMLKRASQYTGPDRNPVILVPPFMASELIDRQEGSVFWRPYNGESVRASTPAGIQLLAVPVAEGNTSISSPFSIKPEAQTVSVGSVIGNLSNDVRDLPAELAAYKNVLRTLVAGGYKVQDLNTPIQPNVGVDTCFQFSYDWRLDNIGNAARLDDFIHEKRAYLQREYKNRFGVEKVGLKFDLVAVGTGCLLSRYYLRFGGTDVSITGRLPVVTWAGARNIDHSILIAPPNAGSLRYFEGLLRGLDCGSLGTIPAAVLGTMPAVYQFLPRARHGAYFLRGELDQPIKDVLDADLWQENTWGLISPAQERVLALIISELPDNVQRVEAGMAYQKKWLERAAYFQQSLDQDARPPFDFDMRVVVGTGALTPVSMAADARGDLRVIESGEGDGTTLRSSVLLDERRGGTWQPRLLSPIKWTRVELVGKDLVGLTRDAGFTDNLLHWLLEEPR